MSFKPPLKKDPSESGGPPAADVSASNLKFTDGNVAAISKSIELRPPSQEGAHSELSTTDPRPPKKRHIAEILPLPEPIDCWTGVGVLFSVVLLVFPRVVIVTHVFGFELQTKHNGNSWLELHICW